MTWDGHSTRTHVSRVRLVVPREVTSSSRGTWRAFIGFTRLAGGGKTFGPCDYCEPSVHRRGCCNSSSSFVARRGERSAEKKEREREREREKERERASRPAARVNETRFGEERREEKRQRRRKWEWLASKKDETMYNTVWKGPTCRVRRSSSDVYTARADTEGRSSWTRSPFLRRDNGHASTSTKEETIGTIRPCAWYPLSCTRAWLKGDRSPRSRTT